MRRAPAFRALILPLAASALAACHGAGPTRTAGGPYAQMDNLVGTAIGDPSTCLLLAERATGKVVYQYGEAENCDRQLPACDHPGTLNARQALKFADPGRLASCPTSADGTRNVGWAEGRVPSKKGSDLIYSADMEGERALPGHEMNARLYDAFTAANL